MSLRTAKERIKDAYVKDPEIVCAKEALETTLGSDANYLLEVLGITKPDLQRLERAGLALKARYETKTGEHRIRWLIFKGALE